MKHTRRIRLVAIATITLGLALIAAFTVPKLQSQRRIAELSQSKKNLEQIAIALQTYHQRYDVFPPVALYNSSGEPLVSWRVLLLPFLGHESLYRAFDLTEPWNSATNRVLIAKMPAVFNCPFDNESSKFSTSYVCVVGERTMFPPHKCVSTNDVTDGLSTTVTLLELGGSSIPWSKPEDLDSGNFSPEMRSLRSPRNCGVRYALFANGDVKALSDGIRADVWSALLTRNGAESIDPTEF